MYVISAPIQQWIKYFFYFVQGAVQNCLFALTYVKSLEEHVMQPGTFQLLQFEKKQLNDFFPPCWSA